MRSVNFLPVTVAVPTAVTAIATIAGKVVKESRDYRRGRGLPYYRGNGVAVSYDRRLARIIGYRRRICYRFHISSPLRRIQPLPTALRQGRGGRSPWRGCTPHKSCRQSLRYPQRKSFPREWDR